ncbi:hypothetical protein QFZ91_001645 [Paraburkholderia sp. JPY419]
MIKRHWIASFGLLPAEIDADRYPCVMSTPHSSGDRAYS